MKTIIILTSEILMPVFLAPAAASVMLAAASTPPTIVAADGILCDVTKKLVAQQARVVCLIPPGADPHTLALRPADRSNLSKADLVFDQRLQPHTGAERRQGWWTSDLDRRDCSSQQPS